MSESIPLDARDGETYVFHETPLRRVALELARFLFGSVMELEVCGSDRIPQCGAVILASNHLSNFDVFAMQLAVPRPIFFMGKAELFRYEPMAALLRDLGAFPVQRGAKDAWALQHARKILDSGQVLGMFPEGHRAGERGLGPAKTGAARLAIETACPILPMALTGSDRILRSFPRRASVCVRLLPPVLPWPGESAEELTDRVMLSIAAGLPNAMRGAYASQRP